MDDAAFEEADMAEVRSRSFPAESNFFEHGFNQFGEDENDWVDDEDDDEGFGGEPECRTQ